ncbi:hypothetical protein [Deinococcus sp.]|uniref:hypothetical protein n=1 Tax=Deinococcus sp. TaxID=47478 RepID=UPI0025C031F0|nr:hypothetical protein [Deinococcus sp.]
MTPGSTPLHPPVLAQRLGAVIGRGTVIDQEAQRQLIGPEGTLSTQLCRLLDGSLSEVRGLLEVRADLPPRRPHSWALLTEFENAAWPIVALSHPPALSALETARIARHLAVSHVAMDQANYRQWAQKKDNQDGTEALLRELCGEQPPTWATLLTAVTTVQVRLTMLHTWGVLSAYLGLNHGCLVEAARFLLARLNEHPALIEQPGPYAAQALWASLWLLHGGLPLGSPAQLDLLARSLRTLPERTAWAELPELETLYAQLGDILPELTPAARRELSESLHGIRPTDPHIVTTGLAASQRPGQMAYWLRRANEVQLVVCKAPAPGELLNVYAWRWKVR